MDLITSVLARFERIALSRSETVVRQALAVLILVHDPVQQDAGLAAAIALLIRRARATKPE